MKAVQINSYGNVDVLELKNDVPEPILKEGQILVEVHAASINPFDGKLRAGYMKDYIPLTFPTTMGGDFSGVVTKIHNNVSDFKIGDAVFGSSIILNGGSGAYADLTAANTKNIEKKPVSMNFEDAAAMPLVGSSAVQALIDHIHLQPGQKVLIHGGAGGIGHIAIQIAKALGAYVATTANEHDFNFVKKLGADTVINYKTQKFNELLKDYDAVFDTVGGETTEESFKVLKKGGILVSMLGQPNEDLAKLHDVTAIRQNTKNDESHLKKVVEFIESGQLHVAVDKVFPLDQVQKAFTYQESGHPRGKVVIKVK